MIYITDNHNCCGCSACVQACPKQCISFNEDEQGFLYPLVNKDLCIDCGVCEKVCPCLHQNEPRKPLKVYAAINPNEEIRLKSSSGGIFTMLAEVILDEGGVVFGARFDENWEVIHDYTETKDGLAPFRGSKYVQSRIEETYIQARNFLKEGRKVLFSGTSCQIAGLKKFLRNDYDNLLTVDVVCHGVPSPLVWREYLKELIERPQGVVGKNSALVSLKEKPIITGISFRDKTTGWKKYGFAVRYKSASKTDRNTVLPSDTSQDDVLLHETLDHNLFMQVFLKNLSLRPSCSKCPSKSGKCGSDLSIADLWGIECIHPELDDDKGISAILANTSKGIKYFEKTNSRIEEVDYALVLINNPCIEHSVDENRYIRKFWSAFFKNGVSSSYNILISIRPSLSRRIYCYVRRFALNIYKYIR